jgi:hypothetical protein
MGMHEARALPRVVTHLPSSCSLATCASVRSIIARLVSERSCRDAARSGRCARKRHARYRLR